MIYLSIIKQWDNFSRTILYTRTCDKNIIMNYIADPVKNANPINCDSTFEKFVARQKSGVMVFKIQKFSS